MFSGRERIHYKTPPLQNETGLSRNARSCAVRTNGYIGDWGPLVIERIHVSGIEAEEIVASKPSSERWIVLKPNEFFAVRNPNPTGLYRGDAFYIKAHTDLCEQDRDVRTT